MKPEEKNRQTADWLPSPTPPPPYKSKDCEKKKSRATAGGAHGTSRARCCTRLILFLPSERMPTDVHLSTSPLFSAPPPSSPMLCALCYVCMAFPRME